MLTTAFPPSSLPPSLTPSLSPDLAPSSLPPPPLLLSSSHLPHLSSPLSVLSYSNHVFFAISFVVTPFSLVQPVDIGPVISRESLARIHKILDESEKAGKPTKEGGGGKSRVHAERRDRDLRGAEVMGEGGG